MWTALLLRVFSALFFCGSFLLCEVVAFCFVEVLPLLYVAAVVDVGCLFVWILLLLQGA